MATIISKNAYVSLGGVDLSAFVLSVNIDDQTEMQDETAMGDNSRKNKPGLYNWSATIEFKQDYAAGGPDATYWASLRGTTFTALINPNSSTTATANPRYSGAGVVSSYNPVAGTIGDLAKASMSIVCAGDLSRATS